MESLHTAEVQVNELPVPIAEWTDQQLEEAYFYLEERLPQSELIAQSFNAVVAEQQSRKELKKG